MDKPKYAGRVVANFTTDSKEATKSILENIEKLILEQGGTLHRYASSYSMGAADAKPSNTAE